MQEFSLEDVFQILVKWWRLCVAVPLLAALLAGYYNFHSMADIYSAKVSLHVLIDYEDNMGNLRFDTQTADAMLKDFQQLFIRSGILLDTADAMGMISLSERVEVQLVPIPQTRVCDVVATGKEPKLCAEAANIAAGMLVTYVNDMMQNDTLRITQRAYVPSVPIGPNRAQNIAFAAVAALVLTVLCILVLELLNTRIKTGEQVEQDLHQPFLGSIPAHSPKPKARRKRKHKPQKNGRNEADDRLRESIKALVSNSCLLTTDPQIKTIALTSALEDQSFPALILKIAAAYAKTGMQVLMVDMDFKNQSLGRLLGDAAFPDLVDYLGGYAAMREIIQPTQISRVSYVGNDRDATVYSRAVHAASFADFLSYAEETFDIVLFNTPPLALSMDAAVLASKVGGVIVAIASNKMDKKRAQAALERLKRGGGVVIGVMLSHARLEKKQHQEQKRNRRAL